MDSQFSQFDGALNVYFVVLSKYGDNENCSEEMWEAFQKCDDNGMSPKWILEDACKRLIPEKTDIFVLQEFEGDLFESLKKTKCLIVGPKCLIHCFLTNEPIPQGTSPIFTPAMRDLVISASGFTPPKKEKMQAKVEYMGGIFLKQLRSCVTHLVTDSVMSAKYEKATETGIQLYTETWIESVWNKNQTEFRKASDPIFNIYKCSVFMNLVVTSTNLSKRNKEEIKKLINENGGEFMGQLDSTKVKVVLAKEYTTLSDKIKFAMQNNIPCLRVDWVKKSLEANYALPFSDYLISPESGKPNSSTPERNSTQFGQPSLNFSTISCIGNDAAQGNVIEETMTNTISSLSSIASLVSVDSKGKSLDKNSKTLKNPNPYDINRFDMRQVKKAGPFLDGCNIYLAGFSTAFKDKVNKILNLGSATRFDDISEALTHVIVGDGNKAATDLKIIKSKGLHPHILSLEWLEESLKLKKPATEDDFLFEGPKNDENKTEPPPSPLSKKNLQMLAKQKVTRPPIPPPPNFDSSKDEARARKNTTDDDESALMEQYLQQAMQERSLSNIGQQNNTSTLKSKEIDNKSLTLENANGQNDSEVPFSQTSTLADRIFEGLTFLVTGFDSEENHTTLANICGLGGKVVTTNFSGIPDYGVVPFTGTVLKNTVNEIVTNLWIDDCIDNEKVLPIEYYHKPISIDKNLKPLRDCVIAISSYAGLERVYLSELAIALGATHQETFARKTNVEKNLFGGTHLICTSPEGNKYNAAVKWRLPAVTKDWLIMCAAKLQFIDETPFLVGETMAPPREIPEIISNEKMRPPLTPQSSNRTILTPKRQLSSHKLIPSTSSETPVINKRLSMIQNGTPKSPFHFSTPETPYGQVFKDNPSPETRKVYAKWIDGLPDKVEEPPKKKRRAPSTPLSEIRRKIWSAMKKPIGADDADNTGDNHNLDTSRNETSLSEVSQHKQNEDDEEEQVNPVSANRQLSFNDEPTTDLGEPNESVKKNEIQRQLEEMNKLLRANSNSSGEGRFSLHNENGKVHEDRNRENNCNLIVTQPESVGWEDPHPLTLQPKKSKFMLSGVKDRAVYEQVITSFGADISNDGNFDSTATHLLCFRPSRNEKMLASIAAGKWILHCSYLHDSEKASRLLDENSYEWGNPLSSGIIPHLENETECTLASAAYRWRLNRQNGGGGPFEGMVAMLIVSKEKSGQFERLIRAGGGVVVEAKPPYSSPNSKKVTHCFVTTKTGQQIEWATLASKGILCFQPQFLHLKLTATEPIDLSSHVIPEFKKYLRLIPK